MLKIVPKEYKTNNIKVARGKYKLPTTIKQLIKKLANGWWNNWYRCQY